jgi:hypothetical protein
MCSKTISLRNILWCCGSEGRALFASNVNIDRSCNIVPSYGPKDALEIFRREANKMPNPGHAMIAP